MEVELSDTESIRTKWIVVPRKIFQVSVEINSQLQNPTTRSISIVSSALEELFPTNARRAFACWRCSSRPWGGSFEHDELEEPPSVSLYSFCGYRGVPGWSE